MFAFICGSALISYGIFSNIYCINNFIIQSIRRIRNSFLEKQELIDLQERIAEIRALLEIGQSPSQVLFQSLSRFERYWGNDFLEIILKIREKGGSLVPVLIRFQEFLLFVQDTQMRSKVKVAPALAQAFVLMLMVPLCSVLLYFLIPEIAEHWFDWASLSFVSFLWSTAGVYWILRQAEKARWVGLEFSSRNQPFLFLLSIEWTLAMVRSGVSPDIAWRQKAYTIAKVSSEKLSKNAKILKKIGIFEQSKAIEKSIYLSMMEGRSCFERLISISNDFKSQFQSSIFKELELLSSRTLKPLFIFLAPAVLLQIAAVIWILLDDSGLLKGV